MSKKTLLTHLSAKQCMCFRCRPFLWSMQAFVLSCCILSLAFGLIGPIHRIACPSHPQNADYTFLKGLQALQSEAKPVSVEYLVVPSGSRTRSAYADSTFRNWWDEYASQKQKSFTQAPTTDSLGLIWIVWHKQPPSVFVSYFLHQDSDTNGVINMDRVKARGGMTGFAIPYLAYRTADENVQQFHQLLLTIAQANPKLFSKDKMASIVAKADSGIYRHDRGFRTEVSNLVANFCNATCVLFFVIFLEEKIRRKRKAIVDQAQILFERYENDYGYPFSTFRLSLVRYGFSCDLREHFLEEYREKLERQQEEISQRIRFELDRKKRDTKLEKKLTPLRERLYMFFGSRIPQHMEELFLKVQDSSLLYPDRHAAADRLKDYVDAFAIDHAIRMAQKEPVEPVDTTLARLEEELRRELSSINRAKLPPADLKRFERMMAEVEDETRIRKRVYLLQQASQVVHSVPDEISTDDVVASVRYEVPTNGVNGSSGFVSDSLIDLLDIVGFIPDSICPKHCAMVIIWGLLRPSKRNASFFKGNYIPEQHVRKIVSGKLGKDFNPEQFENAIAWLIAQRIVLIPKRTANHRVYSLNPHVSDASALGKPIVDRILQFKFTLTQTTQS